KTRGAIGGRVNATGSMIGGDRGEYLYVQRSPIGPEPGSWRVFDRGTGELRRPMSAELKFLCNDGRTAFVSGCPPPAWKRLQKPWDSGTTRWISIDPQAHLLVHHRELALLDAQSHDVRWSFQRTETADVAAA